MFHRPEVVNALQTLFHSAGQHSSEEIERRSSFETAVLHSLKELKEIIMSLAPEVQALVDAAAANKAATETVIGKLADVGTQVTALQAQLAAITPGAAIDAEDLAAIVAATSTISSTVAEATAAVTPAAPTADASTAAPATDATTADAAPAADATAAAAAPSTDTPQPADGST